MPIRSNQANPNPQALSGRVVLITGANTGIGRVTALELAKQGAQLFIACRTQARTQPVLDEIRASGGTATWLALDLADLASVRQCAAAFLATGLPLHILINNAGVAGPIGLTAAGFELAFGTNHLGHFLLTQLLLERLTNSAPARIVTVASRAHTRVKAVAGGLDWQALRKPGKNTAFYEYSVSKLANILFSAELGRRLAGTGVTTYAVHPGVVASDIWRKVPWPIRPLMKMTMITNEQGAATSIHCATAPQLAAESGLYYAKCQAVAPTKLGQDAALAAELWRRSQEWVGQC
jgi:retinol dehydrogenase-12